MITTTYTNLRENLREVMDKLVHDSEVCEVTRRGADAIVMMSKRDYDAMNETLYLTQSKSNLKALYESVQQAEEGKLVKMDF